MSVEAGRRSVWWRWAPHCSPFRNDSRTPHWPRVAGWFSFSQTSQDSPPKTKLTSVIQRKIFQFVLPSWLCCGRNDCWYLGVTAGSKQISGDEVGCGLGLFFWLLQKTGLQHLWFTHKSFHANNWTVRFIKTKLLKERGERGTDLSDQCF